MGAVFQVTHRVTGKRFALKWLLPEVSTEGDAAQRFIREAQVAGRFEHPNVVEVYDVGEDSGSFYMVMELLEGESLAERVQRDGPLSVADACRLLLPCLYGIADAHGAGIIHRDLKPANIYICRATKQTPEAAKVLDFGISKISGLPEGELNSMTKSGTLIGTPHYMPLEQMRGRTVDARTDVYAFGIVLYQVISGRLPFAAQSFSDLVLKVAHDTPLALDEVVDNLPRGLSGVVAKAMAREPVDRFQGVDELIAALSPYADPGLVTTGARKRNWSTPSLSLPTPLSTESHSDLRNESRPSPLRYALAIAVMSMLAAGTVLWTQRERLHLGGDQPNEPPPIAAGPSLPDQPKAAAQTPQRPPEPIAAPAEDQRPGGDSTQPPKEIELSDDVLAPILPSGKSEPLEGLPEVAVPVRPPVRPENVRTDKKKPPIAHAAPGATPPAPEPGEPPPPVTVKPLRSPTGRVPAITEDDF